MRANELGIPLQATALFEYRTLAALAENADTQQPQSADDDTDDLDFELDAEDLASLTGALS